jgi:geranylgeranyl pyrophosphate synthase
MSDFDMALDAAALLRRRALEGGAGTPKSLLVRLPWLIGAALGAQAGQVDPIGLAWVELYDAMRLMDAVQDGDTQEVARDLALSTGLYLRACRSLAQRLTPAVSEDVYGRLLAVAEGQYLDVTVPRPSIAVAAHIADTKSGMFFGAGARLGALAANAGEAVVHAATTFGLALGVLVQIQDDVEWLEAARVGQVGKEMGSNLAIALGRARLTGPVLDELERDLVLMATEAAAAIRVASALIRAGARVELVQRALAQAETAFSALDGLQSGAQEVEQMRRTVTELMLSFVPTKPSGGDAA